jgi:hypothetical protein
MIGQSVYDRLYIALRPPLHALSLHGTRIDIAGMSALAEQWLARTKEIKIELDKLTGGIPLYAVNEELSEEAKRLKETRSHWLQLWRDRPKGRGAAKTPEVQALKAGVEAARQGLADLKRAGGYYVAIRGVGLSDLAIKQYLKSQGIKLPTKRTEKGRSETADEVALQRIALNQEPLRRLVTLILEHRKCLKMASTYCNVEKVDRDGRIRCSWKPCGTQTGRLASSENPLGTGLNQQNIPDHDDYGFRVKRLFLPDQGCVFLKFDLSMAEARNFFWRTGDKQLKEIATSKPWETDVYKWIAGPIMLKKPESEVTKEERQVLGKKIGLSSNYGVGPKRMSDALMKEGYYYTEKQCGELQKLLFDGLPGIQAHQAAVIARSIAERTTHGRILLVNSFGRQIEFIHERLDLPLYHRIFAWPSQSDIGDHNNQLGLIPFWNERRRRGWRSMPNAVVHDENLISACPDEAWGIVEFMVSNLQRAYDVADRGYLSIPVTVSIGLNWNDCFEWKKPPGRDEFMAKLEELVKDGSLH